MIYWAEIIGYSENEDECLDLFAIKIVLFFSWWQVISGYSWTLDWLSKAFLSESWTCLRYQDAQKILLRNQQR